MSKNMMIAIVEQCLYIKNNISNIYQQMSEKARTDELKKFWKNISTEVDPHAAHWDKLLAWANKGLLPQVFEKPENIVEELNNIQIKINELMQRIALDEYINDVAKAFLVAFKLEFYLLHPAFETLFQYLKTISYEKNPVEGYDANISNLFEALDKYGLVTLELELLGKTIHRLWKENKTMAFQNNYDALTGSLNRRGLFNAIKPLSHLARRNNFNIGIMMIDADHFKKINDNFGHQYGDEVLKYIATTIKSSLRVSDVFGRYGGDEFLVFLSFVEPNFFHDVGEKIRFNVEKGKKGEDRTTISIGLSQGPLGSDVENELRAYIKRADEKLFLAKNNGRNRIVG